MNQSNSILAAIMLMGTYLMGQDYRIVQREFVFDDLPHDSCHASTLAETPDGLVICWFGGVREGHPSVGIWMSRQENGVWSKPVELATGVDQKTEGSNEEVQRYPCWNPVLFQVPDGELFLFYKVGPNPRQWWGRVMKSTDSGRTWSESRRLPDGILGPIKNKPILLPDGTLLCGSSTEHDGWKVHVEWATDPWEMSTWKKSPALDNEASEGAIQPTLIKTGESFRMLCRNQRRDTILTATSKDGMKWGPLTAIDLPNPNSGIDAVTLRDGSHLLIYNPTTAGRSPVSVAVSRDGESWRKLLDLDAEPRQEFSYPAVIQTADGLVHVTYTWKRKKIAHLVLSDR